MLLLRISLICHKYRLCRADMRPTGLQSVANLAARQVSAMAKVGFMSELHTNEIGHIC